ncbi:MAG TPA: rhodanese-like domain-containing protein [Planctomycetota bacterium]
MSLVSIDPDAAKALLDSGADWQYLDVRTPEEFARGHAPGACNVPAFLPDASGRMAPAADFLVRVAERFPASTPLVVGCASGVRSVHACHALAAAGYSELANLQGGFHGSRDALGQVVEAGWLQCGLPVATGS